MVLEVFIIRFVMCVDISGMCCVFVCLIIEFCVVDYKNDLKYFVFWIENKMLEGLSMWFDNF